MKVFIIQSNYIPWKGYFDAINLADIIVLYDEMQYTKGDWRNRNIIKTPKGKQWLTIPIRVKNHHFQKINEAKTDKKNWASKHWKSIQQNYSKASSFKEFQCFFSDLYLEANHLNFLSEVNYLFLTEVANLFQIRTKFIWSRNFDLKGNKSEKIFNICKELGATDYLSGSSAKNYLEEDLFIKNDIKVNWLDYSNYKIYPQLHGKFEHQVSIIDLILNVGKASKDYMKSF